MILDHRNIWENLGFSIRITLLRSNSKLVLLYICHLIFLIRFTAPAAWMPFSLAVLSEV